MRDPPQFSVVVPLYNKRAYIRRAVDSVLAQTLTDFELIVVDDGSSDKGVEMLDDLEDDRLRIVQQQNEGVGNARNRGMEESIGRWIAFLDADDGWLPGHLEELSRLTTCFPDAGLFSTTCIEMTGSKIPLPAKPKTTSTVFEVDYFLKASSSVGFVNSTSAAISREVFLRIGGFINKQAGEDLEYWARIALDYSVAVSDRVTCFYFRDTGGVMSNLEKNLKDQQSQRVFSLCDVSPSVAMLFMHAEKSPDLWKNSSIRSYVNSRIVSSIVAKIYLDDPDAARKSALLMISPRKFKHLFYGLLTKLPNAFIRQLIMLYRQFKKIKGKS